MWHHRFNTLLQNPCKFYLPPTLSFTMETTQWTKHVHISLFAKLKSLCLHRMLSKHQLVQVFSFIINWYASNQVEFLKWTLMMSVLFISNDIGYELITCVRRANENARNLIPVVQFLIKLIMIFFTTLLWLNVYIVFINLQLLFTAWQHSPKVSKLNNNGQTCEKKKVCKCVGFFN